MNILTRLATIIDRGHYTWIKDDIDNLQDTCTALRGIGMGGSVAFADVANTIDVHRGELRTIERRLKAAGLAPEEYAMNKLEGALWAVTSALIIVWALSLMFGR